MKSAIDKLVRMVGQLVQSVEVQILFYGVEHHGDAGDVLITFEKGQRFAFGCAGDGSVLVMQSRKEIGDAPGFTTTYRTISNLGGELKNVACKNNTICLQISNSVLVLANRDDDMEIALNGELLPEEVYSRG